MYFFQVLRSNIGKSLDSAWVENNYAYYTEHIGKREILKNINQEGMNNMKKFYFTII